MPLPVPVAPVPTPVALPEPTKRKKKKRSPGITYCFENTLLPQDITESHLKDMMTQFEKNRTCHAHTHTHRYRSDRLMLA